MKKILSILFLIWSVSLLQAAEPMNVTVNAGKKLNDIDERVYSHFLEHIYNSCNGGLWGDLVWNRSFEAGTANEWNVENGTLTQKSRRGNPTFVFGDENWTDYELTCDAVKQGGAEGFLLMFRVKGENFYWVNLGGWKNVRHGVERNAGEATKESRIAVNADVLKFEPIKENTVYRLRLRVEKNHFELFINGEKVIDSVDGTLTAGAVGLGTWDTAASYSNICVKDLKGNVLVNGVPASSGSALPAQVRYWDVTGTSELKAGDARNSAKFIRWYADGTLQQKNYAFEKDENYDFSFWTRGTGSVSFMGQKFSVSADKWTKFTGTFQVAQSTKDGKLALEIRTADGKTLDLDQLSVTPRTWKEKYSGFRPDLLKAIQDIQPELIRWPGGCYASAYRWKSGIGPQDDRGAYPIELWNDVDTNSFGIDEFIKLCEKTGAEPLMVVNIGTKQWTKTAGIENEKIDWLTEVCEWVEYCNGPVTSKWGAVRAKNGHPEPYGVKYWEIDNEVHGGYTPAEEYVRIIKELVPRMKAIDPSITIIACGSWMGNRTAWDSAVMEGAAPYFSFLSTHRYDDPNGFAVNPYENQRFFESRAKIIQGSENPNVRMFDSEWNAQSTDWRTGLHAGGILNCFEAVGDTLQIAAPALFLRHTSAGRSWDNAFVNFDHTGWFPGPNYVVMKLWREHYAPNRVELLSVSAALNGENPIVNAVATRSADGKKVFVKVVNNQREDAVMNVKLNDVKVLSAKALTVTPDLAEGENADAKLQKRNTLAEPNAITPKPLAVKGAGNQLSVLLPSLSATVIEVSVE